MMTDDFLPHFTGSNVYHYTDAGGLIGMVQNHALWATESSGMNDPREGQYGQEHLELYQPSEEHRETFEFHHDRADLFIEDEVFVACASTQGDDVSQWTRYTPWPDVGYCIALDPKTPLAIAREEPLLERKSNSWESMLDSARTSRWSAVVYGQQQFADAMAEFLPWAEALVGNAYSEEPLDDYSPRQEVEDTATTALSALTRLAKDAGFATENEVRVVSTAMASGRYVQSRPSRYGVVRYVELAAGDQDRGFVVRDEEKKGSWERLPITSVTIGPSPFADRGVQSVRRLLKENGYGDVRVEVSECQMR